MDSISSNLTAFAQTDCFFQQEGSVEKSVFSWELDYQCDSIDAELDETIDKIDFFREHYLIAEHERLALKKVLRRHLSDYDSDYSTRTISQVNDDGYSWVHVAALLGDLEILKRAEAFGLSLNVSSKEEETPFLLAMLEGHRDVCVYLLEKNIELPSVVKDQDGNEMPFILFAVSVCNDHHILEAILDKTGAKPDDLIGLMLKDDDGSFFREFTLMEWAKEISLIASLCLMQRSG